MRAACLEALDGDGHRRVRPARACDVDLELPLASDPDGHASTLTGLGARIVGMSSYPAAKRVLDVSISLVLLVVLAPVFAFLFVAMGVDMLRCSRDRGPWLYRETRISRGREFDLLKFRTLRRDVLARDGGRVARAHARGGRART